MEIPRVRLAGVCKPAGRHFHADGDFLCQCADAMFNVTEQTLLHSSSSLRSITEQCRERATTLGRSPSFALCIENTTPRQLQHFFDYLYASASAESLHTLEQSESYSSLHDVLHISSMFLIQDGRAYAIRRLDHLQSITPIQRLHISCDYEVPEWFIDAARAVVWTDQCKWTTDELASINSFLPDLNAIRDRFNDLRAEFAYRGPNWESPATRRCAKACTEKMKAIWLDAYRILLQQKEVGPHVTKAVTEAVVRSADRIQPCATCLATFLTAVHDSFRAEIDELNQLIQGAYEHQSFHNHTISTLKALKRAGYDVDEYRRSGQLVHSGEIE